MLFFNFLILYYITKDQLWKVYNNMIEINNNK